MTERTAETEAREKAQMARIIPIILDQIAVDRDTIRPDMLLKEELGLDSFTVVFFASLVEDEFGTEFTEEEIYAFRTLRDILDLLPRE